MQPVLRSSVTALPVGRTALALQVSQTLTAPFPCTVLSQRLEAQAGLALTQSPFPSALPFTIQPQATQRSLFSVCREAGQSATRVAELACQVHTTYCVQRMHMAALPLQRPPAGTGCCTHAVDMAAAHLPEVLSSLMLHSRTVHHKVTAESMPTSARVLQSSASLLERVPDGEPAALCAHIHTFSVELSSFAALSLLDRGMPGAVSVDTSTADLAPAVVFMGPRRVVVDQDTALMWQIRWPAAPHSPPLAGAPRHFLIIAVLCQAAHAWPPTRLLARREHRSSRCRCEHGVTVRAVRHSRLAAHAPADRQRGGAMRA